MVTMLVERMLPAALADDAQQHLLTRMHVRIAVVRLVGILEGIVRIHVVGHRASVNHVVRGKVRLSRDFEAAPRSASHASAPCRNLLLCLAVNSGIHLRELEEIFAVVTGLRVVVGGARQGVIRFTPVRLRSSVLSREPRSAVGGSGGREHNDCSIQAHLNLQVALRSAVIGARTRRRRNKRVRHRASRSRLPRQQPGHSAATRCQIEAREQNRGVAGRSGKVVRQIYRDGLSLRDDQCRPWYLHDIAADGAGRRSNAGWSRRASTATRITPGVDHRTVRLADVSRLRRQVEGRTRDARSRRMRRSREQQGHRRYYHWKQFYNRDYWFRNYWLHRCAPN